MIEVQVTDVLRRAGTRCTLPGCCGTGATAEKLAGAAKAEAGGSLTEVDIPKRVMDNARSFGVALTRAQRLAGTPTPGPGRQSS